jgi:hypothetical protein
MAIISQRACDGCETVREVPSNAETGYPSEWCSLRISRGYDKTGKMIDQRQYDVCPECLQNVMAILKQNPSGNSIFP